MTMLRGFPTAAIGASLTAVVLPTIAHASPLPDVCTPATVIDNVCTLRLTSVTADAIDGTITGTPVGGGAAITLAGPLGAYQRSEGFGDVPPAPIQRWDTEIDSMSALSVDPNDPSWYGNAKSLTFMPRTLNDLATQFPPNTLTVRFTSDDARSGTFQLVSIKPTLG